VKGPGTTRAYAAHAMGARWLAFILALAGCAAPAVTQDGQLVFTQHAQTGATVLTATGLEHIDRDTLPSPVIRRSAYEPWRPPTGFLLPADGILRQTSDVHSVDGRGLAVVVRSSDALVPSWGGEILLRLDTVVPTRAFEGARVRPPLNLSIVLDTDEPGDALALIEVVLDSLGERDRIALVDTATRGHIVLPPVPGSHRSLCLGAAERRLAPRHRRRPRDLTAALRAVGGFGRPRSVVVVLSDGRGGRGRRASRAAVRLGRGGARILSVGSHPAVAVEALGGLGTAAAGPLPERIGALEQAIAPPGDLVVRDLALRFQSAPAPVRLIEASGGEVWSMLDDDRLVLGDLYANEGRTEVVRLAVPQWVPGESFRLTVSARYRIGDHWHRASTRLDLSYSDAVERIASSRHGDVIAYASALAMVRRLERVFLEGERQQLGGLSSIVRRQAASMSLLARHRQDPTLARQARVLETLLDSIE
jgi:hypothetical protein